MRREFLLCILVSLLSFCGTHDSLAFEGVGYDDISENAQILGTWNVDVVNVSSYPAVGVNNYKNFLVSLYSNYESGLNNSEHWEMVYIVNGTYLVKNPFEGNLAAGDHIFGWTGKDENGRDVPSGVYFVSLNFEDSVISQRCTLLK